MTPILLVLALDALARSPPPAIVRLQRASRDAAVSFLYSGLVRGEDPLVLFDDGVHEEWWFGESNLSATLLEANVDRDLISAESAPLPSSPLPEFNSPLLKARAERAEVKVRVLPNVQSLPEPSDGEPVGPATCADDRRGDANRGLCRQLLERVDARRAEMEGALLSLLDPAVTPQLPAIDCAVLLLFMAELHEGLPLPVACSEAVELSVAYGGAKDFHRHVNGVLKAYHEEYGLAAS